MDTRLTLDEGRVEKGNKGGKRSRRECNKYFGYRFTLDNILDRTMKTFKPVHIDCYHHCIIQRPPAPLKLNRVEIGVAPGKKLVGMGGMVKGAVDGGFVVKSPGMRVAE